MRGWGVGWDSQVRHTLAQSARRSHLLLHYNTTNLVLRSHGEGQFGAGPRSFLSQFRFRRGHVWFEESRKPSFNKLRHGQKILDRIQSKKIRSFLHIVSPILAHAEAPKPVRKTVEKMKTFRRRPTFASLLSLAFFCVCVCNINGKICSNNNLYNSKLWVPERKILSMFVCKFV